MSVFAVQMFFISGSEKNSTYDMKRPPVLCIGFIQIFCTEPEYLIHLHKKFGLLLNFCAVWIYLPVLKYMLN